MTVRRLRMKAVLDSIDGGNGPGTIELRDVERNILATLIMTKPSFHLVGDDLHLAAPASAFVAIAGTSTLGTITDGSGNLIIDDMSVGVDPTIDEEYDYEICLDNNVLEVGKQVTIVTATIEHG